MNDKTNSLIISEAPLIDIVENFIATTERNYDGVKVLIGQEFIDGVEAAQARVNELVAMSKEDIEQATEKYNLALKSPYVKPISNLTAYIEKNIDKLLDATDTIQFETKLETYEVASEATYILEQIHYELSKYLPQEHGLPTLTSQEWYNSEVTAATNNLQRKIKQFEDEDRNVRTINQSIALIRKLLSDANV